MERKRERRKLYLKDVNAKHLIEEGPEFGDDDEEEEEKGEFKSYNEEQEEIRREFLEAAGEVDGEDDEGEELFRVKEGEEEKEEVGKKLDEYFGSNEKLDENAMFLKEYFRNKMWLDKGEEGAVEGDEVDVEDAEEEVERQEDYEREFNFRFEEGMGDRVMGHSRVVEGSVRKKMNVRKLQRERKEEVKRLKNLKKKEMNEKLTHDRKMKEAFDDEYYVANDVDPEFGSDNDDGNGELEKPDFDKEDELFGLPKGWDDVKRSVDGFQAARERTLKKMAHKEEEEVVGSGVDKKKKKHKRSSLEEDVLSKELDEY